MAGRVILYTDLNSYFTGAETLKNSVLEGQLAVTAGLHRRSVVSTISCEARKYGVHGAMPLHMIMEKYPNLVVAQGDHGWYEESNNRFFKYLRRSLSLIEPASIDECYMDVTDVIKDYKRLLDPVWRI